MKTLYLDIFSGISGDMFIGALLDLGVSPAALEKELSKLGLDDEFHLHVAKGSKAAIAGTKFDVHVGHHGHGHAHAHHHDDEGKHHHRGHHHDEDDEHLHAGEHGSHDHHHGDHHHDAHSHGHDHDHDHNQDEHEHHHGRGFSEIREKILESSLSAWVKEKAVAVFQRIANAEGKIHGLPPEQVHFHEVGAVDSIVDIVGACIALDLLGRPRVLAAPVVDGHGFIQCAHGRFPIPAPATLEILAQRGIAISQTDEPHELITPTGAALLAEFVEHFGPMQNLGVERVGFGLGTRDNRTRPNVLRALFGSSVANTQGHDWETDTVAVVEANLDDINAEILGNFVEVAFAKGALDVFHTPIQMKKNRPGVLLTVICQESAADIFAEMILRETSSFGVRISHKQRRKLQREFVQARTSYGQVTVKVGKLNGKVIQIAPEYESCRALAEQTGQPVKSIYEAALRATSL